MRKPTPAARTKIWLAALAAAFVLLLVLYLTLIQPLYNGATDGDPSTTTATVNPVDGEAQGITSGTLLMYPRIERVDIRSIEVFNSYKADTGYSSYTFLRDSEDKDFDGDTNDFIIDGYPANTYDDDRFSRLVVDTGYTACLGKLDIDFKSKSDAEILSVYADYGLSVADNPTYFRITRTDGTAYTVYLGAKTADGNYYARVEGRAAIYVLYSDMKESVLAPLVHFVNPTLTFEQNHTYAYTYIRNFAIFHDRTLVDGIFGAGSLPDGEPSIDAASLDPFVMLTYLPGPSRDLFHANSVYAMLAPNPIYTPSDIAVTEAFEALPGLLGTETLKLGLTEADFREGGLLADVAYTVYYEMPYDLTFDEHEEPTAGYWVKNILFCTRLAEDGTYTVGSMSYTDEENSLMLNMIAKVSYDECSFLERTLFDWIQSEVYAVAIDNVASLAFSSAAGDYTFDIAGDGTATQTVTERTSGYQWTYKGRNQPFTLNSQGYCEDISQFRQLYTLFLMVDYAGEVAADGLSEGEMNALLDSDSSCLLTLAVTLEDGREMTYRFYPYSERHALVSVSGPDTPTVTGFYTSAASVRRLATASRDLMTGTEIDSDRRFSEE